MFKLKLILLLWHSSLAKEYIDSNVVLKCFGGFYGIDCDFVYFVLQIKVSHPATSAPPVSRPSPAPGSCFSMLSTLTASASTWTTTQSTTLSLPAWLCLHPRALKPCPAPRSPLSLVTPTTHSTSSAWPRLCSGNTTLRRGTWKPGCLPRHPSSAPLLHRDPP